MKNTYSLKLSFYSDNDCSDAFQAMIDDIKGILTDEKVKYDLSFGISEIETNPGVIMTVDDTPNVRKPKQCTEHGNFLPCDACDGPQ